MTDADLYRRDAGRVLGDVRDRHDPARRCTVSRASPPPCSRRTRARGKQQRAARPRPRRRRARLRPRRDRGHLRGSRRPTVRGLGARARHRDAGGARAAWLRARRHDARDGDDTARRRRAAPGDRTRARRLADVPAHPRRALSLPRRGRSRAVPLQLHDARRSGCRTASLQSTPMAERMCVALGLRDLGRIPEYEPQEPSDPRSGRDDRFRRTMRYASCPSH